MFFFFLFISKIFRSVSFVGSSVSVPGRWTANCPFIFQMVSGFSFPIGFHFKCDACKSILFYSSHVGVPVSFSLSSPSQYVLNFTLFPDLSIPNSISFCFFHYSSKSFNFGYLKQTFSIILSIKRLNKKGLRLFTYPALYTNISYVVLYLSSNHLNYVVS